MNIKLFISCIFLSTISPGILHGLPPVLSIEQANKSELVDIKDSLDKAYELLEAGSNEEEVIDLMTKVIEIDSLNDHAYFYRGRAYEDLYKNKEALKDLNKAINLKNNIDYFYNARGRVNYELGNLKEAINDYKNVAKIDPSDVNILGNAGLIYLDLEQHDEGIKILDEAIKKDPKHANNIRIRGYINYEKGNIKEALSDFNKALAIPSRIADEKAFVRGVHANIYYDRGYANYDLVNIKNACSDWSKGAKLGNSEALEVFNEICLDEDGAYSEGYELSEEEVANLMEIAGGEEEYNRLINWASQKLPQSYIDKFDLIITEGNIKKIKAAILDIQKKYNDAN